MIRTAVEVISIFGVVVATTMWVSGVSSTASEAHAIANECAKDFKQIDERLSRIEGKLGTNQ